MVKIVYADTDERIQQFITLAGEYITWFVPAANEHYPQLNFAEFMQKHAYQDLSAKFPGEHVPPYGRLFLALDGDQPLGCVALGKLSESICEMRTMFVRPAAQGKGIGRLLAEKVLEEARQIGYTHMRLDTMAFLETALTLYGNMGFKEIEPYLEMPGNIRPYMRFLELDLRG